MSPWHLNVELGKLLHVPETEEYTATAGTQDLMVWSIGNNLVTYREARRPEEISTWESPTDLD